MDRRCEELEDWEVEADDVRHHKIEAIVLAAGLAASLALLYSLWIFSLGSGESFDSQSGTHGQRYCSQAFWRATACMIGLRGCTTGHTCSSSSGSSTAPGNASKCGVTDGSGRMPTAFAENAGEVLRFIPIPVGAGSAASNGAGGPGKRPTATKSQKATGTVTTVLVLSHVAHH